MNYGRSDCGNQPEWQRERRAARATMRVAINQHDGLSEEEPASRSTRVPTSQSDSQRDGLSEEEPECRATGVATSKLDGQPEQRQSRVPFSQRADGQPV